MASCKRDPTCKDSNMDRSQSDQDTEESLSHQVIKKTYCNNDGLELLRSIILGDPPEDQPHSSNQPDWCICGKCQPMPLLTENVCC